MKKKNSSSALMKKKNSSSALYLKILVAIIAVLVIVLLIAVPRILAEKRFQKSEVENQQSIYEHFCDIVDAVYSDEYDVKLVVTSGLKSIDCTEDFKETCRSMYESGDYQSIYNYYLEQEYSADIPENLILEWEKSDKY